MAVTPAEPRKSRFVNGVLCALVAAGLLWGSFREFTPPPEEAKSAQNLLEESEELLRWSRELNALQDERSKITDAIDARIEMLEARRAEGRVAERDEEIRRLRATWFAEMEETNRLTTQKMKEREEREWQAGARRREQVARAAWAWERHRRNLLAVSASAWLLAGWLLWQALLQGHRQAVTRAAGEAGAPPLAADRAAVEPPVTHEGDRPRRRKLPFYLLQVTVCVGLLLCGSLGSAEHFDRKYPRDMFVFFGLFGLATSTLWFFHGTIDWSDWSANKARLGGRKAPTDTDAAHDDDR